MSSVNAGQTMCLVVRERPWIAAVYRPFGHVTGMPPQLAVVRPLVVGRLPKIGSRALRTTAMAPRGCPRCCRTVGANGVVEVSTLVPGIMPV
jgi:hypothetical protein